MDGSVIPYEGLRKCDYSRPSGKCLHGEAWGPFGTGQNCGDAGVAAGSGKCRPVPTVPFMNATDRGMYGGTYVGLIGGAVSTTSHPLIPQFDINANDRFSQRHYPTALLYNPQSKGQTVALNTSTARRMFGESGVVDLYETTSDRVVLTGASLASGNVSVQVPARQAIVVVAVPAGCTLQRSKDGLVTAGNPPRVVRFRVPSKTDDTSASSSSLVVEISPQDGSFKVSVGDTVWLQAASPAFHLNSGWWQQQGPATPTHSTGTDGIGTFSVTSFSLAAAGGREVIVSFKEYVGGQTIVFGLRFPLGANGTRTTDSATACHNCVWPTPANNYTGCLGTSQGTQCAIEPATRFPAFKLDGGLLPSLGFKTWEFTFGIDHSSGHNSSTGDATEAGFGQTTRRNHNSDLDPAGGAPVVLFREFDSSTIVISPLDHFMTAVGSTTGGEWATGVSGEVEDLPPGFEFNTVLHLSNSGITDAVLGWGAALRRYHNTTRNTQDDIGLKKLGYWTDNVSTEASQFP